MNIEGANFAFASLGDTLERNTIFSLFTAPAPISAPQGYFGNKYVKVHPNLSRWDISDPVKNKISPSFQRFNSLLHKPKCCA